MYLEADGKKIEFRSFRDDSHPLEMIADYATEIVMPILSGMRSACTIRCSYSGLPIAFITQDELKDCLASAIEDSKMSRFNSLAYGWSAAEMVGALEGLIDHVEIQMILARRRSPSLQFTHGGTVEHVMQPAKQLCILLNLFLFDTGKPRSNVQDLDSEINEARRMAALADYVVDSWDDTMQPLLSALVELDAKYRIRFVQLRRVEQDEFRDIKKDYDRAGFFLRILNLVEEMIRWRDENATTYVGARAWTQTAFHQDAMRTERESRIRSNIIVMEDATAGLRNAYKTQPKTPEQQAKADNMHNMFDAIAGIFGGAK